MQSLTGCADLEDLGICAPQCGHSAASPFQPPFPDFLRPRVRHSTPFFFLLPRPHLPGVPAAP